jgi:hypothetical protein
VGTLLALLDSIHGGTTMPEKKTLERAKKARREGKAASTQAGEFVREEIHHVREGKHGAESTSQAIAIGLAKARRAGVKLPPPPKAKPGKSGSRATNGKKAVSKEALARHARSAARKHTAAERSAAARKAARTRARRAK